MVSATESLAIWTAEKTWDSVSPADQAMAVEAFIDTIGVAVAGIDEPVSTAVRNYVSSTARSGPGRVWGTSLELAPAAAAFANGTSAMSQEFDDRHTCTGHPSCILVPALLGIGQSEGLPGRTIVEAYAAALGVFAAVAELYQENLPTRGWHATSTLGVVAGAAGVAKALDMKPADIEMAIGIAVSLAAGVSANFGSQTKPLHAGWAARSAIEAALLAREGVTSAPDALYGELGGMAAFGHVSGAEIVGTQDDLDRLTAIADDALSGLIRKQFPTLGSTHLAAEAALEVHDQLPTDSRIVGAHIQLSRGSQALSYLEDPVDPSAARHSFRFVVAVTLARGLPVPRYFDDAELYDRDTRRLMDLLTIDEDTSGPYGAGNAKSPSQYADLSVRLEDGTEIHSHRTNPPRNVKGDAVDRKFLACTAHGMGEGQAHDLLSRLRGLTAIGNLADLFDADKPTYTP